MRRAAFIALVTGAAALTAGDWPHLGRDAARTRRSPETVGTAWSIVWSGGSGFAYHASPSVADGVVVAGDTAGHVIAWTPDGTPLWTFSTLGPIEATPLIAAGAAVVGDGRFQITALDVDTGTTLWSYAAGGTLASSPVAAGGAIYTCVGLAANAVVARDAALGAVVWTRDMGQPVFCSPAVTGTRVIVANTRGEVAWLDTASGALAALFTLPGTVQHQSPLIYNNRVYLATSDPDARLAMMHADPSQWGVASWVTPPLADPAPPPGAETMASVSSAVAAGGRIWLVVRFDHRVSASDYRSREFLFAFDPDTGVQPFGPLLLGEQIGATPNVFPQARFAPTPAAVPTASGDALVVVSAVANVARLLSAADGSNLIVPFDLGAPSLASPAVANGRIYFATLAGTVWCVAHGANEPPSAPSGLTPAGGVLVSDPQPTLSWTASTDADDSSASLEYIVRGDTDGEVLADWQWEVVTAPGATSAVSPVAYAQTTLLTWRVRSRDPKGALSAWSEEASFWVVLDGAGPQPPSNFTAQPGDGQVWLSWDPSPSASVVAYELAVRKGTDPWGPYTDIGNVTTYHAAGLTNGATYTFRLRAKAVTGETSTPVETSATPLDSVALNGTPYPDVESAAAAAQPGDTIRLGYGVFVLSGPLLLPEGVSLYGVSPHETTLLGVPGDAAIRLMAGALPRGTIGLMTVTGASVGIDTNGYSVVIQNVVLRDMQTGVRVPAASDVLVKNATVARNELYGVYVGGAGVEVRNSILLENGIGVYCEPGVAASLRYNDVYDSPVADYGGCSPGEGSISAVVAFRDAPAGDFRVQPGQPTIDAGDPADAWSLEPEPNGNRINMGAYGNTRWAQFGAPDPAGGGGGGGGGGGADWASATAAGPAMAWILALFLAAVACRRRRWSCR